MSGLAVGRFHDYLDAFFGSFTGLEHVSLLINGSHNLYPVSGFTASHVMSLKTLLFEQKKDDLRQSDMKQLERICLDCPNLVKLGIVLPITKIRRNFLVSSEILSQGSHHSPRTKLSAHRTEITCQITVIRFRNSRRNST